MGGQLTAHFFWAFGPELQVKTGERKACRPWWHKRCKAWDTTWWSWNARPVELCASPSITIGCLVEVSSPGIDRPLRNEADFARFVGQVIDITLRQPMGGQAAGLVAANRKKFRGTLEATDSAEEWQIVWRDEPESKPGFRPSKKRAQAPLQALRFRREELREARLAPIVNFKGRSPLPDASEEVHHES
jgi:ribosome maturation factor RimP